MTTAAERGREKAEEWRAVLNDLADDVLSDHGEDALRAFQERIITGGRELEAKIDHEMWERWQSECRRAQVPKATGSPKAVCYDMRDIHNLSLPSGMEEASLLNSLADFAGISVDDGYTAIYDPCIAGWYLIEGKGWVLTEKIRREIDQRQREQEVEYPPEPSYHRQPGEEGRYIGFATTPRFVIAGANPAPNAP
jgi:hypothetical protein